MRFTLVLENSRVGVAHIQWTWVECEMYAGCGNVVAHCLGSPNV